MFIRELPAANSVKVRQLFVKAGSIGEAAAVSVRMIALEDEGIIGRSGSCTLIKAGCKRFVVATRHSLQIPRNLPITSEMVRHVRFSTQKNGYIKNIVTDAVTFERVNPDEEFHDLLLFHVADDSDQDVDDGYAFYPLTDFKDRLRKASMMIGHPTVEGVMNYDPNHIRLKTYVGDCKFDPDYQSSAQHLTRFLYEEKTLHVDGLSGGAVFSLVGEMGSWELALDGVIVRGGNGGLYVIDRRFLIEMTK
ncbi:MAG: hypothetical protein ACOZAA_08290 [Pseudomonadota bacterium]